MHITFLAHKLAGLKSLVSGLLFFQKRILDGSLGFAAGVSLMSFELNSTHTEQVAGRCHVMGLRKFHLGRQEFLLEMFFLKKKKKV